MDNSPLPCWECGNVNSPECLAGGTFTFKIRLNSPKSTWIHHGSLVTVLLHNTAHLKKQTPTYFRFLTFTIVILNYLCFLLTWLYAIFCPFVCLGWVHLSGNYDSIMIMSAPSQSQTTSVSVCAILNTWLETAVELPVPRTSALNTKLMVQLMKNIWLMKNTPSDASCL